MPLLRLPPHRSIWKFVWHFDFDVFSLIKILTGWGLKSPTLLIHVAKGIILGHELLARACVPQKDCGASLGYCHSQIPLSNMNRFYYM